jgi:hypothetical protein
VIACANDLGRTLRTLADLQPLQILARPPHALLSWILHDLPGGHAPPSLAPWPMPPAELRAFAEAEKTRGRHRLDKLPAGSLLRAYEEQYGLELGADATGPPCAWMGGCAVRPYPASVRARRIAVAIRCGRRDLDGELARAARAVLTQLELHLLGNHLLDNGLGLVCAGAVTRGAEADLWWGAGRHLLDWQLPQQFLPDGGHFERSATYHLALCAGLCEAIELTSAAGRQVPAVWLDTARRALGWALAVRAPDGTHPLFNDASLDAGPAVDDVLALGRGCGLDPSRVGSRRALPAADHRGRAWRGRAKRGGWGGRWGAEGRSEPFPDSHIDEIALPVAGSLRLLPDTGWLICFSPSAWLCLDAGPDGAPYQGGHVHADSLTFELWVEGERAVVDYGVSSYGRDAARAETRGTRVHNTLTVAGEDSSEVWSAFRVGRRAHARILATDPTPNGVAIECEHDGYTWLAGRPVHRRQFVFTERALTINDQVASATPYPAESRLRLAANARLRYEGGAIMSSDDRWHREFATPQPARVLTQAVSADPASGAHWLLRW